MNAVKRGVHYWSWVFLESMGIGAIVVVCVLAVRIILEKRDTKLFQCTAAWCMVWYCGRIDGAVCSLSDLVPRPASCFNFF